MQSHTEKNSLFQFDDEEKIRIEEMMLNYRIVEVIKNLMKENNIKTKADLAKRIGVTSAYMSKIFRSDKNINVNFLVKLQRIFDTTFEFAAQSLEEKELPNNNIQARTIILSVLQSDLMVDKNIHSKYEPINESATFSIRKLSA